jgi:6-phosphogluconolactonase (cycloisomerase 2 family)
MKFSKLSQLFLVSSIGLLVAVFLTACQIVTIDYVFVAGSKSTGSSTAGVGEILTYAADSESGALRVVQGPVATGGSTPVAMAVSADYSNLYVANQITSTSNSLSVISHFTVANNGLVTLADSVTLPSTSGTAISLAVNPTSTYLYVVSGNTSNTVSSVKATLTQYALTSGTIGTATTPISLALPIASYPNYAGDELVPTGVTVLADGNAVYVTTFDLAAYNPSGSVTSSNPQPGFIFGFVTGSGGTLTATTGSPYAAGVKPSALVADPTNRFVYATDYASNELIGYSITDCTTGSSTALTCPLSYLLNGPFRTGNEPVAVTIDPRGKFMYVANSLDASITAFTIDLTSGTPTGAINPTGSSLNHTNTQPLAIAVDPALGRYVYTADFLGDSVTGFRLDPTAGTLTGTQSSPYPTNESGVNMIYPTSLVVVPHGNHSAIAVAN